MYDTTTDSPDVREIPISLITVPDRHRRPAKSNDGIPNVRRMCDKNGDPCGLFELISGENALDLAKRSGNTEIACRVRESTEREKTVDAIIAMLRTGSHTMFDEAEAFSVLRGGGMTQDEIAARMGCSQSLVANKIRLLRLTETEREIILRSGMTERHARTFLRLPEGEVRLDTIRTAAKTHMTVAATEEKVDGLLRKLPGDTASRSVSRFLLTDARPFYNTVNRAAEMMNEAGVGTTVTTKETDEETVVTIRLVKPR